MRNLKRQNQRNVERERKRAFTFHLYGGVVLGLGDKVRANLFLRGDTGMLSFGKRGSLVRSGSRLRVLYY